MSIGYRKETPTIRIKRPLTFHAPVLEGGLYVPVRLLRQVLYEVPLVLELVVAAVPHALEQQVLVAVRRGALRGAGRGLRHPIPPAPQQQVGGGLLVLLLCSLLVVGLAQDGQVAPLQERKGFNIELLILH